MAVDVESDGFVFLPETIAVTRITEDADYEGVRVKFILSIEKFIMPVVNIILTNDDMEYTWTAPGPWLVK